MSKITSGSKPTTSSTGTARQTGSARQAGNQASKTSKTGKATRVRKPLTPAQRKRKQERDRQYRARKSGKLPAAGTVSAPQGAQRKTVTPRSGGCSSAEAASSARKWLTEVWSALKPGESQTRVFTGGGRRIRVEVLCGQSRADTPQVPNASEDVFDGLVAALLQHTLRLPARCGVDFGRGYGKTVFCLVPGELALREQLHADVQELVDARRGWLHDDKALEGLA